MGYLGKEAVISNVIPPMISNSVKMLPLILSLFGASLAFVIYDRVTREGVVRVNSIINVRSSLYTNEIRGEDQIEQRSKGARLFHIVYTFFNSAWQFNYVINHFIVSNV